MKQEYIRIFNASPGVYPKKTFEYPEEMSDPDEIRKYQGFPFKQEVATPFFISSDDHNNFFDIISYRNEEAECICEFWDHNGALFRFFCCDEEDELKLICQFVKLARNLCQTELAIKELNRKEQQIHDC